MGGGGFSRNAGCADRWFGRVRARIEHVFGAIDKQMGGLQVRSIGLACATFHVGLTNLCYNMLRTLTLLTSKPFVGNV
ncbi:MAG TPA: transposase [Flavobacteriales bacterium]|nr:transposase [Flavobacteriales bacterium]